jgi:hypothetical protein
MTITTRNSKIGFTFRYNSLPSGIIKVSLGKSDIGTIRKNKDGLFQYQGRRSGAFGQPFNTLLEVYKTIEG